MSRYDDYVLKLQDLKKNIEEQKVHCQMTLNNLSSIETMADYADAATQLEKDNIEDLIVLISSGLETLEQIVWE